MQNELDIVRGVSRRLDAAGIAYMLTGSMAMNYYAQPRMTRDIDLVVALAARDIDTVIRLFHPDYYVSRDAVSDAIAQESIFNVIHQESVIKVDCITARLARIESRNSSVANASRSRTSPPASQARKISSSPSSLGPETLDRRRNCAT